MACPARDLGGLKPRSQIDPSIMYDTGQAKVEMWYTLHNGCGGWGSGEGPPTSKITAAFAFKANALGCGRLCNATRAHSPHELYESSTLAAPPLRSTAGRSVKSDLHVLPRPGTVRIAPQGKQGLRVLRQLLWGLGAGRTWTSARTRRHLPRKTRRIIIIEFAPAGTLGG